MTRLTASAAALFQSFREPEFVHADHVIPPLSLWGGAGRGMMRLRCTADAF